MFIIYRYVIVYVQYRSIGHLNSSYVIDRECHYNPVPVRFLSNHLVSIKSIEGLEYVLPNQFAGALSKAWFSALWFAGFSSFVWHLKGGVGGGRLFVFLQAGESTKMWTWDVPTKVEVEYCAWQHHCTTWLLQTQHILYINDIKWYTKDHVFALWDV